MKEEGGAENCACLSKSLGRRRIWEGGASEGLESIGLTGVSRVDYCRYNGG